jgi:hypothetical protein
MFKVMALLKRRTDLSLRAFIDHYETRHAPLGLRYLTAADRYRRRYLDPIPYPLDGRVAEPAYDVLTELWFADRGRYDEGMAQLGAPEASALIVADEERFLDRTRSRLVFVEEHRSVLPGRDAEGGCAVTCCALLKRRPGMGLDEFIDYYETRHARLGERLVPAISRYRRHYLRPAPYPLDGSTVEAAYDVVTELGFPDQAALEEAGRQFADPETMRIIAEDEAQFVDPFSRCLAFVEDRESTAITRR